MSDVRTIRVFIASPGDLAPERRAFKEVIEALNGDFAQGARVKFVPLGWEDTVSPVGRRPQSEFNAEVEKCDVFFLALWRRWGQASPDVTPPATSYTEEEFNVASARLARTNKREPIIHALFKKVPDDIIADAGPQLQKVLDFRTRLAKSGEAITLSFDDEPGFRKQADRLLRHAAHQLMTPLVAVPVTAAPVELPDDRLKAIEVELAEQRALSARLLEELKELRQPPKGKRTAKAKKSRDKQATRTRAKVVSTKKEIEKLQLAERAAQAALEGRVEKARQGFAQATEGTSSMRVLYLAYEFYYRTGDLTLAESLLERWIALSGPDAETAETAAALGNLALVYHTRGEFDRAEEMHRRSLAIEEKLGHQEGVATDYGHLGLLYLARGDLGRAEEMHRKALAIHEELGHREGVAANYGNLGMVYRTRGDLDRAEEMHLKALAIEENLGDQESMAAGYGNLGLVYQTRGDLDRAEEMFRKSLAIEEKLGHQEGMATDYGHLGLVYRERGDFDRAEEMHRKSLAIEEKFGHQEGIATDYGHLGLVYRARGDLDRAEEMYRKALAIDEKIGCQEGMAADYGNLGDTYLRRNMLDEAESLLTKSLELSERLQFREYQADALAGLGTVARERGDQARARNLWTQARELYSRIGIKHKVQEMTDWLDQLPPAGTPDASTG